MVDPDTLLQTAVRAMTPDATCPVCHYSLRDASSAVCPECGEALEPWVRHEPPSWGETGILISAMLAFAVALGGLMIVLLPLVDPHSLREFGWRGLAAGLGCIALATIVGAALLRVRLGYLAARRRRWSPAEDWLIVLDAVVQHTPVRCGRKLATYTRGLCGNCARPLQLELRPVEPVRLLDPRRPELGVALSVLAVSTLHTALQAIYLVLAYRLFRDIAGTTGPAPPGVEPIQWPFWTATVVIGSTLVLNAALMCVMWWNRRLIVRWPRARRTMLATAAVVAAIAPWVLLTYLQAPNSAA